MTHAPSTLVGTGIGRGAVIGPVVLVRQVSAAPVPPVGTSTGADGVRAAFAAVGEALAKQAEAVEGTRADVLEAAVDIARDPVFVRSAVTRVESGADPVSAVTGAANEFGAGLEVLGGYFAERVSDVRGVRDRVVAHLTGVDLSPAFLTEPSVIVALDLSPADTASLDLANIAAIVTQEGGATGHTAIIARQHGIPCIVRVDDACTLEDGQMVAVDAARGTVAIDPGTALRRQFRARAEQELQTSTDLSPGRTADDHPIALLANIGSAHDVRRAAEDGAQGVGLFRTELLYLDREAAPGLDEQAQVYRDVLDAADGKKVVVRLLDAGADKPLAFADQHDEPNPALGIRGYRLTRTLPDLIDTQVQALGQVTADAHDNLWVMAPMITTAAEAHELRRRATSHGIRTVGVMIEVPAAALGADQILDEVDFVSVGTNDLAQYTMASDRLDGRLDDLLSPWQPAVLELVERTARAGAERAKPVGICGESAADPLMALVLTGMGVTSLSMASAALGAVRYVLARHTLDRCRQITRAALRAPDAVAARAAALALADPDTVEKLGL